MSGGTAEKRRRGRAGAARDWRRAGGEAVRERRQSRAQAAAEALAGGGAEEQRRRRGVRARVQGRRFREEEEKSR